MKKKILIVVGVVIALLLIKKLLILAEYKADKVDLNRSSILNEVIEVKETKELSESDFLVVKELALKNYFRNYKPIEDSTFNGLYDDEGNLKSYYYITFLKQYVDLISFKSFELASDRTIESVNASRVEDCLKEYFKKNKVENDIDLLAFIRGYYYFKSNIFTSNNDIKSHYLLNTFVSTSLPEFNSITLITGNLNGYIINTKAVREIHLLTEDEQYVIILGGEITSNEFVKNLLETITIG